MWRYYSTSRFCTLITLFASQFQALRCYENVQAFSPSYPRSVTNTKKYLKSTSLDLATAGSSPGILNQTSNAFPIHYDPSRVRFRCRVAYDGTSFSGFQLQGGRGGPKTKKAETTMSNTTQSNSSSSMTKKQRKQKRNNEKYNNNPRTIQGELEKVLSQRFQRLVKVVGAGRTDGGVHARGQAIHFDLYHNETERANANSLSTIDSSSFERDLETTMNRMLPSDIRVWNVGPANRTLVTNTGSEYTPPGWYNWNAMRTSTSKLYSYRICIGDAMNPSERHHRWQLPWRGVDPDQLKRILHYFEGEHDFVCFAGALEQQEKKTGIAIGTVRTIHKIKLVQETVTKNRSDTDKDSMGGDTSRHYYRIDIYLDGALYKMVRNIVGTAIDVARGWLDEGTLIQLLKEPSELNYTRKDNVCKPAPSNGLTLERVFYPDEF